MAVFCAVFALFQAALALGAPFGQVAWGGSDPVLPASLRAASAGAAVYLGFATAVMLVRAGDIGRGLPRLPFMIFNGILAFQLGFNTLANLAASSGGERYGMGAASIVGCVLCFAALFGGARLEPKTPRRDS